MPATTGRGSARAGARRRSTSSRRRRAPRRSATPRSRPRPPRRRARPRPAWTARRAARPARPGRRRRTPRSGPAPPPRSVPRPARRRPARRAPDGWSARGRAPGGCVRGAGRSAHPAPRCRRSPARCRTAARWARPGRRGPAGGPARCRRATPPRVHRPVRSAPGRPSGPARTGPGTRPARTGPDRPPRSGPRRTPPGPSAGPRRGARAPRRARRRCPRRPHSISSGAASTGTQSTRYRSVAAGNRAGRRCRASIAATTPSPSVSVSARSGVQVCPQRAGGVAQDGDTGPAEGQQHRVTVEHQRMQCGVQQRRVQHEATGVGGQGQLGGQGVVVPGGRGEPERRTVVVALVGQPLVEVLDRGRRGGRGFGCGRSPDGGQDAAGVAGPLRDVDRAGVDGDRAFLVGWPDGDPYRHRALRGQHQRGLQGQLGHPGQADVGTGPQRVLQEHGAGHQGRAEHHVVGQPRCGLPGQPTGVDGRAVRQRHGGAEQGMAGRLAEPGRVGRRLGGQPVALRRKA